MIWVRSWPAKQDMPRLKDRARVKDALPKIRCVDFDLGPGLRRFYDQVGHADLIVIEWDLAVSPEDKATFEAWLDATNCLKWQRVGVAPYRLYTANPGTPYSEAPWVHRRLPERPDMQIDVGGTPVMIDSMPRWVTEGEPTCDWFGFGLIYLPFPVVRDYLKDGGPMRDTPFSQWYSERYGTTPICWDCRPVHLHV